MYSVWIWDGVFDDWKDIFLELTYEEALSIHDNACSLYEDKFYRVILKKHYHNEREPKSIIIKEKEI